MVLNYGWLYLTGNILQQQGIFLVVTAGGHYCISWGEANNAGKYPTSHRKGPHNIDSSGLNVNSAGLENLWQPSLDVTNCFRTTCLQLSYIVLITRLCNREKLIQLLIHLGEEEVYHRVHRHFQIKIIMPPNVLVWMPWWAAPSGWWLLMKQPKVILLVPSSISA